MAPMKLPLLPPDPAWELRAIPDPCTFRSFMRESLPVVNYWKTPGVYVIEAVTPETTYYYIGSSCRSFASRWSGHFRDLAAGRHRNPVLQRIWNKYGAIGFSCYAVEVVYGDAVIDREQYWANAFKFAGKHLVNMGDCVVAPFKGKKLSAEHVEKMASAKRGKKLPPRSKEWIEQTMLREGPG